MHSLGEPKNHITHREGFKQHLKAKLDRYLDGSIGNVQETYSSTQTINLWESEWGGQILASHGSTHSRGEMIM